MEAHPPTLSYWSPYLMCYSDKSPKTPSATRHKDQITQHLKRVVLRARGQNRKLADDIELLPIDSQDRLFRILEDMDQEMTKARRASRNFGFTVR